ncbi:MAG: ssl1498 family light-harvesting-like protein [Cyanobacteria bacterium P01_H01_bin.121]
MPYTVEEGGRLNNFAKEPRMSMAEPPSKNQQLKYIMGGVAAVALIGGLFAVAAAASSVG